jgi:hypothetical protein
MNAAEQLEVIKLLHAVGATHFKSHDFEIKLGSGDPGVVRAHVGLTKQDVGQNPAAAPISENTEATEKLKDLIKTMSLSPEQLVDVVFPAGAGG